MKFKKTDLYVLLSHSAGNEKRQAEQYLINKYNLWQYVPLTEQKELQDTHFEIDKKFAKMLKVAICKN